ncbi:MAG: CapA family protein [Deltaproteobacteria bacterium]|nr:CapA family protein [Deltaproteobacteria bacterium]
MYLHEKPLWRRESTFELGYAGDPINERLRVLRYCFFADSVYYPKYVASLECTDGISPGCLIFGEVILKHLIPLAWCVFLVSVAVAATSCKSKPKPKATPKNLPVHTLVYGGDFTLARRLNFALFDEKARSKIMEDVALLFRDADIALVNGEGVVAAGGYYYDKGEPRPYMYRAHPLAIDVLKETGIDVVTVGNNHFGDYGPEAMREMLDRLRMAGIDYAGGGVDRRDAQTPAYIKAGDVVVAIVGGDFTMSKAYVAKKNRAGIFYRDAFRSDKNEDEIVEDMTDILNEARKHAHLVILSPHWGDNWQESPAPHIRSLGKRLIRAGYDAIIGHSAHMYQGVEMIDGKPVIYDAGNLVSDFGPGDRSRFGMAWKLSFTKAGIKQIEGYPLLLRRNVTLFEKGRNRDDVLSDVVKKSADMDTALRIEDGHIVGDCTPGNIHSPRKNTVPIRKVPKRITLAPNDTILDALPDRAIPINVEFEDGISLVGYELLTDKLQIPKSGQVVQTYWRTSKKLKGEYIIRLEARHTNPKTERQSWTNTEHLPGDWLMPADRWPEGKIIRDWQLFRLKFDPQGEVDFYAALVKGSRTLKPKTSDRPLEKDKLVYLGKAKYSKDAKRLLRYMKSYQKKYPPGK